MDRIFFTIIAAIFGLAFGSFSNVLIWRVPNHESLLSDSHCPNCNAKIHWYQNIPLFSWIFLRGKCANCKKPISIRYPIVELLGCVSVGLVAYFVNPQNVSEWLIFIGLSIFAIISIVLSAIDIDVQILPTVLIYPILLTIVALFSVSSVFSHDWNNLLRAFFGMFIAFGFYFILNLIWKGGMGFGDVRLSALIGFIIGFFSWYDLVIGIIFGFFFAAFYSVLIMIIKKGNMKTGIPFGPWMLVGAWFALCFGNIIGAWYISLI